MCTRLTRCGTRVLNARNLKHNVQNRRSLEFENHAQFVYEVRLERSIASKLGTETVLAHRLCEFAICLDGERPKRELSISLANLDSSQIQRQHVIIVDYSVRALAWVAWLKPMIPI
jgi:hypothetical protein